MFKIKSNMSKNMQALLKQLKMLSNKAIQKLKQRNEKAYFLLGNLGGATLYLYCGKELNSKGYDELKLIKALLSQKGHLLKVKLVDNQKDAQYNHYFLKQVRLRLWQMLE